MSIFVGILYEYYFKIVAFFNNNFNYYNINFDIFCAVLVKFLPVRVINPTAHLIKVDIKMLIVYVIDLMDVLMS